MAIPRTFIAALIIAFPLTLAGQSGHPDVTDALSQLISFQDKCATRLKAARTGDDVAAVLKDLGDGMRDLGARFAELEKKYPPLFSKDTQIPPDISRLIADSGKASRRLSEITLISLYRYGTEQAVGTELERLKNTVKALSMPPSRSR
ncbi:MAG TPA: hypothetical protein PKY31_06590 [Spirochaetota bacterium]|nr:hypothetical protein [Spirochaetota bacterium]